MSNDNHNRSTPSGQPVTPANGGVPPLFTPPIFYTPILYPLIPPAIPRTPGHDGQFRGPPTIYRQVETSTGPVPAFTPRASNERRVEFAGFNTANHYNNAWYYDATDYERNLGAAQCEYRTARSHAGYVNTDEGMPTCLIQAVGGAFHPAVEVNGLWVGPQPTVDFPPDLVQPIVPMQGRMGAVRMRFQPGPGNEAELKAKLAQAIAALSEVNDRLQAAERDSEANWHSSEGYRLGNVALKETNERWKQALAEERKQGDDDHADARARIATLREENAALQAKLKEEEQSLLRELVKERADHIKAIEGREDAEGRAETAERRADSAERRAETAEVTIQRLLKRIATDMARQAATDMARQAATDGVARAIPEVKANPPSMKRKAADDDEEQPDTKRVKPDTAPPDTALGTSTRKSHAQRLPRSVARTSARYATAWNRNAAARNACREVIPFTAAVIAVQTAALGTATTNPPTLQQPVVAPPHRAAAGNVNAPKVWSFARPTASSLQHAARQAKSRSRPVSSDAAALGAQVVGGKDGGVKAVNPRKTVAPRK